MKTYIVESDEVLFLHMFNQQKLANNHPFHSLLPEDILLFSVEKRYAAVADVSNDGSLLFRSVWRKENRTLLIPSFLQDADKKSIELVCTSYRPLFKGTAEKLLASFNGQLSDIHYFFTNFEDILADATKVQERMEQAHNKHTLKEKIRSTSPQNPSDIPTSEHTKAQFYLKELALITGCDIWTANNDKNRIHKNEKIGANDLVAFPNLHLEPEAKKSIQLIDTTWFKGDVPIACFEIECTSQIYSGLLRMTDIIASMPNNQLRFYIVAPISRRNKVRKEFNRPVFKQLGIHLITRFISIENLEVLYQKVRGLNGYVDPKVVDSIAFELSELTDLVT